MNSYRGAKLGHIVEDEDGTTVLEDKYYGGRSFHLTSLDDLGYKAEEDCR